jgi:hypothetical protein
MMTALAANPDNELHPLDSRDPELRVAALGDVSTLTPLHPADSSGGRPAACRDRRSIRPVERRRRHGRLTREAVTPTSISPPPGGNHVC